MDTYVATETSESETGVAPRSTRAAIIALGVRMGAVLLVLGIVGVLVSGRWLVTLLQAAGFILAGALAAGMRDGERRAAPAALVGVVAGTVSGLVLLPVALVPEIDPIVYRNWFMINHTMGTSPHWVGNGASVQIGLMAVVLYVLFAVLLAMAGGLLLPRKWLNAKLTTFMTAPLGVRQGFLLVVGAVALHLVAVVPLAGVAPAKRAALAEAYYYRGIAYGARGEQERAIVQI